MAPTSVATPPARAVPATFAAPFAAGPFDLAPARPTRGFAVALAPPRAGEPVVLPPLEEGAGAGSRTLEIDAAVGLLKRSAALLLSVAFLTGVGTGGCALRARARDAAVGANRPVEGVFGRDALAGVPPGVFGRKGVEGVFARLGVETVALLVDLLSLGVEVVDFVDLIDVPVFWGRSGCAVGGLLGVVRTGDFCGVLVVVAGRVVGALIGVDVVDAGFRVGGVFVVVGLEGFASSTGSAAGGDCGAGASIAGSGSGKATVSRIGGDVGSDDAAGSDMADAAGETSGLSPAATDFGGHSLRSLTSSLAESPVMWDVTLVLRGNTGGTIEDVDCRFCSKRPMRFATLWRGRSSGSGLTRS